MNKIDIQKVRFRNWFSYGDTWTEHEFKKGITVVKGKNGQGKTTFLSTIPFALFGQLDRTRKISSVVNWKNNKNCEVQLFFKKNNIEYIFHRGLSPNKFLVYENGDLIRSTASKTDFQKQLEEDVLGIDFKTFMNLIYTNPNSSVSLLKAKKQDKRVFLERMFDLGYFSELSKKVQSKITKNQENIAELEKEVYKSESVIEVIERDLNELVIPDLSTKINEITELKESLKQFLSNYKEWDNLLIDYNNKKQLLDKQKDKYYKLYQSITNKIKYLTRKKDKFQSGIVDCKNYLKKDKKDISIDQIDLNIKELEVRKTESQKEIDDLKSKEKDNDIKLSEVMTHIKILKGQYESYMEQDINVKPGDVCPTCSREMEEEYYQEYVNNQEQKKKELNEQIISYSEKLSKLKNLQKEYKHKSIVINKELSSIEETLLELHNDKEEYTAFINKRDEIISLHDNYVIKKKKYEKILMILNNYKDKNQLKFNDLDEKAQELYDKSMDIKEDIDKRDNIINNIDRKEAVLSEQKNQLEKNKKIKQEKENSLKGLKDNIVIMNKKKKSLFTLKDYLVYFKDMLKDEEVKQYAIGELIPFLTKQANYYLSQAGYEYYLEIDSWLDITIKGPGVRDSESGNMSGGEEKSIDLSIQYAFLDLIYSKSLMFPNLLIQDEILDSSIDSDSLENFLDIVKTKQRENDLSLYIISHRKEVDLINPDYVIEVNKKNGFSKIKEI